MSLSYSADDFVPAPRDARSRRPMLAPLLIGVALAAVTLAGQSKVGAWLRGFLSVPRRRPPRDGVMRLTDAGFPLQGIRDRILGHRKASVVANFGPPRTAVAAGPSPISLANQGAFWHADTWYYPVDAATQTAMAVTFVADVARDVEFFDAPGSD